MRRCIKWSGSLRHIKAIKALCLYTSPLRDRVVLSWSGEKERYILSFSPLCLGTYHTYIFGREAQPSKQKDHLSYQRYSKICTFLLHVLNRAVNFPRLLLSKNLFQRLTALTVQNLSTIWICKPGLYFSPYLTCCIIYCDVCVFSPLGRLNWHVRRA